MFPIRDHNPSGRTPYVVYTLLALNIGVYLLQVGFVTTDQQMIQHLYSWSMIPARITSGDGYYTLVTSMFLHGGFWHIAGNMLFLWVFGDNLEDRMGHLLFLAFYTASGVGAGLAHVMSAPGSLVPTVGASGAIAGVMGGYMLLFPKARVDVLIILIVFIRIIPVPAWIMLALWFTWQTIGGFGADPEAGGVAYWAHSGGFVIGLVLTLPLWFRLGGPGFWTNTQGRPPNAEAQYRLSRSRIPRVPRR